MLRPHMKVFRLLFIIWIALWLPLSGAMGALMPSLQYGHMQQHAKEIPAATLM